MWNGSRVQLRGHYSVHFIQPYHIRVVWRLNFSVVQVIPVYAREKCMILHLQLLKKKKKHPEIQLAFSLIIGCNHYIIILTCIEISLSLLQVNSQNRQWRQCGGEVPSAAVPVSGHTPPSSFPLAGSQGGGGLSCTSLSRYCYRMGATVASEGQHHRESQNM